jgi:anaerobic selenocysteine-containing dehydrogenase
MANIDRRDFLKLVGAGSVGAGAGFMLAQSIKHPVEHLIPYPVPPEDFSAGIATFYNSVCSMCSAGCGITVRTREGRAKKIEGNPSHPVNQGRLCALGQAGLQVLYNPDRLTAPMLRAGDRGSSSYTQITWEDGLSRITDRLASLSAEPNGKQVCLLTGGVRGHLADVFSRFMAQMGSGRLIQYDITHPGMLYTANQRFFGQKQLPYYDLEKSRYVLSFGADFLGQWISPVHYGLGFGRSRSARQHTRGQFVQIEPRMSISGAAADEWIAARPGTDGMLALGLAHEIVAAGAYTGSDRDHWAQVLELYSIGPVADSTGIPGDTIRRLAETFASADPSLAIGGGAAGGHSNGVDTLVAVNALNYLAGNIGQEGGIMFNPASPIATAMQPDFATYRDMAELAADARAGRIDVLILNQSNPLHSLPASAGFHEALEHIPMIVSLSAFEDETTAMADLILPSHTYLESWGDDFPEPGVCFPVGSISQPVVSPLYNTRPTGDIILEISHRMGLDEALPWVNMKQRLKAGWREIYDRGSEQDNLESFDSFWASVVEAGVWGKKTECESVDFTVAPEVIDSIAVDAPEFDGDSDTYPFVLYPYLSNHMRDGRGANLPWLQELPDPMTSVVYGSWVEMNPVTAQTLGFKEGDLVRVESTQGHVTAPVLVFPAIMPEVIAMPIGQGHNDYGRYAKNRGTNPLQILAPQTESETGELAWGATRVKLVATGRKATLLKTSGVSRELGRDIIQTTGSSVATEQHTGITSIPIKVVPS